MTASLLRDLTSLLGPVNVLHQKEDLMLYEYDGSVEKGRPDVVVFPHTTEEVSRIVKLAARHQVSDSRAWRRNGFVWRRTGARWRRDDRIRAHEPYYGN